MRQNKRTNPTRAILGGKTRCLVRLELRATSPNARHEANPAESKAVRRINRLYRAGRLAVKQRILAHRNSVGSLKRYIKENYNRRIA